MWGKHSRSRQAAGLFILTATGCSGGSSSDGSADSTATPAQIITCEGNVLTPTPEPAEGECSEPTILRISPRMGKPGTEVTIEGHGFGLSQGISKVTFNAIEAVPHFLGLEAHPGNDILSWSDTKIVAKVPYRAANEPGLPASVVVSCGRLKWKELGKSEVPMVTYSDSNPSSFDIRRPGSDFDMGFWTFRMGTFGNEHALSDDPIAPCDLIKKTCRGQPVRYCDKNDLSFGKYGASSSQCAGIGIPWGAHAYNANRSRGLDLNADGKPDLQGGILDHPAVFGLLPERTRDLETGNFPETLLLYGEDVELSDSSGFLGLRRVKDHDGQVRYGITCSFCHSHPDLGGLTEYLADTREDKSKLYGTDGRVAQPSPLPDLTDTPSPTPPPAAASPTPLAPSSTPKHSPVLAQAGQGYGPEEKAIGLSPMGQLASLPPGTGGVPTGMVSGGTLSAPGAPSIPLGPGGSIAPAKPGPDGRLQVPDAPVQTKPSPDAKGSLSPTQGADPGKGTATEQLDRGDPGFISKLMRDVRVLQRQTEILLHNEVQQPPPKEVAHIAAEPPDAMPPDPNNPAAPGAPKRDPGPGPGGGPGKGGPSKGIPQKGSPGGHSSAQRGSPGSGGGGSGGRGPGGGGTGGTGGTASSGTQPNYGSSATDTGYERSGGQSPYAGKGVVGKPAAPGMTSTVNPHGGVYESCTCHDTLRASASPGGPPVNGAYGKAPTAQVPGYGPGGTTQATQGAGPIPPTGRIDPMLSRGGAPSLGIVAEQDPRGYAPTQGEAPAVEAGMANRELNVSLILANSRLVSILDEIDPLPGPLTRKQILTYAGPGRIDFAGFPRLLNDLQFEAAVIPHHLSTTGFTRMLYSDRVDRSPLAEVQRRITQQAHFDMRNVGALLNTRAYHGLLLRAERSVKAISSLAIFMNATQNPDRTRRLMELYNASTPEPPALVKRGRELFDCHGCSGCHTPHLGRYTSQTIIPLRYIKTDPRHAMALSNPNEGEGEQVPAPVHEASLQVPLRGLRWVLEINRIFTPKPPLELRETILPLVVQLDPSAPNEERALVSIADLKKEGLEASPRVQSVTMQVKRDGSRLLLTADRLELELDGKPLVLGQVELRGVLHPDASIWGAPLQDNRLSTLGGNILTSSNPELKVGGRFDAYISGVRSDLFAGTRLPMNPESVGYRVPKLIGLRFKVGFLHDGSLLKLEDIMDAERIKKTYVPTGFKTPPPGYEGVPGHQFSLLDNPDERAALLAFLRTL